MEEMVKLREEFGQLLRKLRPTRDVAAPSPRILVTETTPRGIHKRQQVRFDLYDVRSLNQIRSLRREKLGRLESLLSHGSEPQRGTTLQSLKETNTSQPHPEPVPMQTRTEEPSREGLNETNFSFQDNSFSENNVFSPPVEARPHLEEPTAGARAQPLPRVEESAREETGRGAIAEAVKDQGVKPDVKEEEEEEEEEKKHLSPSPVVAVKVRPAALLTVNVPSLPTIPKYFPLSPTFPAAPTTKLPECKKEEPVQLQLKTESMLPPVKPEERREDSARKSQGQPPADTIQKEETKIVPREEEVLPKTEQLPAETQHSDPRKEEDTVVQPQTIPPQENNVPAPPKEVHTIQEKRKVASLQPLEASSLQPENAVAPNLEEKKIETEKLVIPPLDLTSTSAAIVSVSASIPAPSQKPVEAKKLVVDPAKLDRMLMVLLRFGMRLNLARLKIRSFRPRMVAEPVLECGLLRPLVSAIVRKAFIRAKAKFLSKQQVKSATLKHVFQTFRAACRGQRRWVAEAQRTIMGRRLSRCMSKMRENALCSQLQKKWQFRRKRSCFLAWAQTKGRKLPEKEKKSLLGWYAMSARKALTGLRLYRDHRKEKMGLNAKAREYAETQTKKKAWTAVKQGYTKSQRERVRTMAATNLAGGQKYIGIRIRATSTLVGRRASMGYRVEIRGHVAVVKNKQA